MLVVFTNADKYLQKFDELMEDTERIDMQYLKLYLIGLPGVGKTTFRKRLTKSLVNISSLPPEDREYYSTHLAECIQTLCIFDEENFDMKLFESLDDEIKAYFRYLLGMTEKREPDSDSTQAVHSEDPLDSKNAEGGQLDPSPVSKSNETTDATLTDKNGEDKTKSKLSRVLAEIRGVVASGNYSDFISRHKILLNIIDVGGQPGFLEMLPFICGGPGIFFIFFPLDKEFDKQYQICYQRKEDRITPYEANYSIRETIAQILSGISYHTSEILPINDKYKRFTSVKPTITLIGTFKDKLEHQIEKEVREAMQQQVSGSEAVQQTTVSEEAATKTRQRLEQLHKSVMETTSKSYFSEFVVPANASEDKIFFEVDNYEGDDKDLNPIRAHILSCLRANKGSMKVPIRPVQLLFSIILRKEYQIVELKDCMKIGNELNMDEATVDFTLWYFNQLGTVIYRPEIGGWFKENVICSPQVIFNSISTLIIEPLLKLHRSEKCFVKKHHDNWMKKGQFLLETIEKSLPSSGGDLKVIPLENLIIFLRHVHLISPIKAKEVSIRSETSVVRYFMPAILDCATQDELLTASPPLTPGANSLPVPNNDTPVSLLLFFKYGSDRKFAVSVPIGLFCAMIAKLVSDGDEDIFGAEWKLVDSLVKRNIVSFHVDVYNHIVTLVSHAGCYEIRVTRSDNSTIDLHDLCTYVYTTIMTVLKELNHFVCPTIGFICPCGQHQDTRLRVLDNSCVIVVPKREAAFFQCLKTKKTVSLVDQQYYHPWITKVRTRIDQRLVIIVYFYFCRKLTELY